MTAILCAVDTEARPFWDALTEPQESSHAMLKVREGYIDSARVVVVRCGVCKVNAALAAQILINRFPVARMFMSGTAGGMDRRLRVGDTVVATETVYHDVQASVLTEQHPYMDEAVFRADADLLAVCRRALAQNPPGHPAHFGRIATGETFIIREGRAAITQQFEPLCVDMETAAAAHACYVNNLPFLAVRSISDTEDDSGYGSFYQNASMAAEHSFRVVRTLLAALHEAENNNRAGI